MFWCFETRNCIYRWGISSQKRFIYVISSSSNDNLKRTDISMLNSRNLWYIDKMKIFKSFSLSGSILLTFWLKIQSKRKNQTAHIRYQIHSKRNQWCPRLHWPTMRGGRYYLINWNCKLLQLWREQVDRTKPLKIQPFGRTALIQSSNIEIKLRMWMDIGYMAPW